MFEAYRRPGKKRIRLYLGLWAMLVLTSVWKPEGQDLGTVATLKKSRFARVMFMDVGALSTLGALYAVLAGKSRARFPAALASLFVGSFALLPYLAYEDWRELNPGSARNESA
ncbi:hypothetical protein [Deinococcus yavapaiensis]|nr:hypothetical protein [Deinococcus yavapaiensis]